MSDNRAASQLADDVAALALGIKAERDRLKRENGQLKAALVAMIDRYTALVNCGDCGNWDPETEDEVIAAHAVLTGDT